MRLKARLPKVEPNAYTLPKTCPYGRGSEYFRAYGVKGERRPLRDIGYTEVVAYRHQCVRCGRTFRVYPQGVSKGAAQSERLRVVKRQLERDIDDNQKCPCHRASPRQPGPR